MLDDNLMTTFHFRSDHVYLSMFMPVLWRAGEFPSVPEPDGLPTGSDEGVDVGGGVPESPSRVLQLGSFQILPPSSPSAESRDTSNPSSSLPKQPMSGGWGSDEGAMVRGDPGERSDTLPQYGQQSRESIKAAAIEISHHAGEGGGGVSAGAASAAAEQSRADDNAALQELDALMSQTSTDILAKYAGARSHFNQKVCTRVIWCVRVSSCHIHHIHHLVCQRTCIIYSC